MDEAPILYVSAISGLEIGMKYKTGKLQLPMPPIDWFEGVLKQYDISVMGTSLDNSGK